MNEDLKELVARTLDATPELIDSLPELLADLEEIGARVREVLPMLRAAGVGSGARVLDLGCGKGAVAIALARELGVTVHGVDAISAFVDHARTRAAAAGVGERCAFEVADLRETLNSARDYDVVTMLALGDVIGDLGETVAALRACVRPGGLVLIDDGYLADDAPPEVADEVHCLDRAASHELLCSHGDELVAECVIDGPETTAEYHEMTAKIAARAEVLAERHPERAEALRAYAARQEDEVDLLTGPVVGVLWLMRTST